MLEQDYRLLWSFAKDLHRTQAKTLVEIAAALIRSGEVRSFSIARELAKRTGVRFKSAVQRFYRWVGQSRLDEMRVWSALASHLLRAAGPRPLVAVDWTEWHRQRRVLSAAVALDTRAIPILVQTFPIRDMPRSQNTWENAFLHQLVNLADSIRDAVLIFDRGFRRISFIRELRWLRQTFIVRLAANVQVAGANYLGLLSQHPLRPGEQVELGVCTLGQHDGTRIRVVGMWAHHQDEPWWLATSSNEPCERICAYYDRRMGIEEQFRDTKGCRYGLSIKWTAFTEPHCISRLFLLTALAMVVWYTAAVESMRRDPSLRLPSASKGPRRSLLAIGIEAVELFPRILRRSAHTLHRGLPPPHIRAFT